MRIHADSDIQPCMDKKYFCRIRIQTFSVASAPERDWLGFYAEIQVVFDTVQNKFVNTCYTLAKRLYKISRLFHHLSPPPLPEDKGGEGWRTGKKNERCSLKQASLLSASTLTDASQKNNNIYYPNCTVIFCNFSGPKLGVIYSRGSTFSQIEILEM